METLSFKRSVSARWATSRGKAERFCLSATRWLPLERSAIERCSSEMVICNSMVKSVWLLTLTKRPIRSEYRRPVLLNFLPRTGSGRGKFSALNVAPVTSDGVALSAATTGCDLLVTTVVDCASAFESANVGIEFYDAGGYRLIDANIALNGEFISLTTGQAATVTFRMREVLLKPGNYRLNLWLGRGGIETMDYVEFAGEIAFHEPSGYSKHPQVFPGPYQCRFSHEIEIQSDPLSASA